MGDFGEIQEKVLSLDKREMVACAMWFKDCGALNEDDVLIISEVAAHRNMVAHELPAIIGSKKEVSLLHLHYIYVITAKIDNWWIREIEIPTNPDFDDRTFSEEELSGSYSMRMMMMSMLIEIAEGNDTKLSSVYEMWKKHITSEPAGPANPPPPPVGG